jgi:hypothetical protein
MSDRVAMGAPASLMEFLQSVHYSRVPDGTDKTRIVGHLKFPLGTIDLPLTSLWGWLRTWKKVEEPDDNDDDATWDFKTKVAENVKSLEKIVTVLEVVRGISLKEFSTLCSSEQTELLHRHWTRLSLFPALAETAETMRQSYITETTRILADGSVTFEDLMYGLTWYPRDILTILPSGVLQIHPGSKESIKRFLKEMGRWVPDDEYANVTKEEIRACAWRLRTSMILEELEETTVECTVTSLLSHHDPESTLGEIMHRVQCVLKICFLYPETWDAVHGVMKDFYPGTSMSPGRMWWARSLMFLEDKYKESTGTPLPERASKNMAEIAAIVHAAQEPMFSEVAIIHQSKRNTPDSEADTAEVGAKRTKHE